MHYLKCIWVSHSLFWHKRSYPMLLRWLQCLRSRVAYVAITMIVVVLLLLLSRRLWLPLVLTSLLSLPSKNTTSYKPLDYSGLGPEALGYAYTATFPPPNEDFIGKFDLGVNFRNLLGWQIKTSNKLPIEYYDPAVPGWLTSSNDTLTFTRPEKSENDFAASDNLTWRIASCQFHFRKNQGETVTIFLREKIPNGTSEVRVVEKTVYP